MRGRRRPFLSAAAFLALASLAGCGGSGRVVGDAPELERIESTTSFGMCGGYCTTTLEISKAGAVLIRSARGARGGGEALPDQTLRAPLSAGEWNAFVRLAAEAKFEGLPPVIGCPDCADGGAESLTVEYDRRKSSVSIEYGAKIDAVAGLLEKVRAKRTQMTPAER